MFSSARAERELAPMPISKSADTLALIQLVALDEIFVYHSDKLQRVEILGGMLQQSCSISHDPQFVGLAPHKSGPHKTRRMTNLPGFNTLDRDVPVAHHGSAMNVST